MSIIRSVLGTAVFAAVLSVGAIANAAVYKYTEGNRAQIDGSTIVTADGDGSNDTAGAPPGFVLATIGGGDDINLHGRIINIQDRYTFTANAAFSMEWIFEGYMVGGSLVDEDRSGFSGVPVPGFGDNSSTFTLTNLGTLAAVSETFTTDINSTTGDPQRIFPGKFAAGTYELFIASAADNKDALYDIRISAVPLPAGALLLVTGLAGLGIARRRRKAA